MIKENVWTSLENESFERTGLLRRRLLASSIHEVFAVIELPSRERQLVLMVPNNQVSGLKLEQTEVVRLEVVAASGTSDCELRFKLLDQDAIGVFAAFCGDLLAELSSVDKKQDGFQTVYSRYLLWRRLLGPASRKGLSRPQQQGLVGELLMLRELLEGGNPIEVVGAWFGPLSGTTDFVFSGNGIEVKTVASHAPEIVRISSETQLSLVGLESLTLCVYVLMVRENGSGATLTEVVREVRSMLSGLSAAEFEKRLIAVGFHDAHSENYSTINYSVVQRRAFSIVEGFPSIRRESLQSGIGNVSYDLALDACSSFAIPGVNSFVEILGDFK